MHLPKAKELYVREWRGIYRRELVFVSFLPLSMLPTSQASVREVSEREIEREKKERWSPLPLSDVQGKAVRTTSWDMENTDV